MSDVDTKVRKALLDLADQAPVDPVIPSQVRRRVRRRRAANLALAGALGIVVVSGVVFGVAAAIRVRGNSLQRPAGQTEPWPGLYPAATRQEGEDLQACVDAGSHGTCARYVNLQDVVRGYAIERLGWPGVYFTDESVAAQGNVAGPVSVRIGKCSPVEGRYFPKGCVTSDVTVERLIRQDETGVWFVIAAHESVSNLEGSAQQPATEAQAKAFVEKFMALRMEGAAQALGFLSATAKSQYDDHNSGLSLYDTAHGGREGVVFKSWHITETREADANSYEVFVTIEVENGAFGEGFAVGPGQDYKGDLQPLVIRAVIGGP